MNLRCEASVSPIGLDVPVPRLSWELVSEERGRSQSAYRILVASSPAPLAAEEGDLWDSGRVESAETFGIEYGGKTLASHQACYWSVRVWDDQDRPSAWSETATWTTGFLDSDEWKGSWIGFDEGRDPQSNRLALDDAEWIAHADDPPMNAPAGERLYTTRIEIPAGQDVVQAELVALADNRLSLAINGKILIEEHVGWKTFQPLDVTQALRPGTSEIRIRVGNDEPGPAGLLAALRVTTSSGARLSFVTDTSWRSTGNVGEDWATSRLDSTWAPCVRLGEYGMGPWGEARREELVLPPISHLRRAFTIQKPVRRALLYGTALGIVDFHLNGSRISDEFFTPGWTDYNQRVRYRAWDVTDRITTGENALGAILADGWYSGHIGWGRIRDHYGRKPRIKSQLLLEYEDGAREWIASDASWSARSGPTVEADFLMGERFDATQALDGWDQPGFDAEGWQPVSCGAELDPQIEWHPGPPVRVVGEFEPQSLREVDKGVWIFDLGRNIAGVVRLRVRGMAGQEIRLRFAERLDEDGRLYTANLRGARAQDSYVCRGTGVETWTARYTYHGFQYVEVSGLTENPTKETVRGLALSSDTPIVGGFSCSSGMLNALYQNAFWTQRANFIDVPTDCPQRDERLGWTGDAQAYIRTATLLCDVQSFFDKWLVDLADAQREDGQFPQVAPLKVAGSDGGPAWADAGVICPWTIYDVYGDRRVAERQYPSMVRFIEFCRTRCRPNLLPPEDFHCFGDWLNVQAPTPKEVIFTAYFAYSTALTARVAKVLGRDEDTRRWRQLFEDLRQTFQAAYVDEDGHVKGRTQTGYVLALAFNLLDEERAERAAEHLVADIEARGNHLSTGFIGTKDLMLTLSDIGREDIAYRLLMQETYPSWGFSIRQGATSIWERWDGWTPERGFQDPGMNSFAHYSFGAVCQWMVENIGGIQTLGPAYRHLLIAPRPGGGLTWARTHYDSIRGRVATDWKIEGGVFSLEVQIPPNCRATLIVPTSANRFEAFADPYSVRVDGKSLVDAGVDNPIPGVLELTSGTYRVTAPYSY